MSPTPNTPIRCQRAACDEAVDPATRSWEYVPDTKTDGMVKRDVYECEAHLTERRVHPNAVAAYWDYIARGVSISEAPVAAYASLADAAHHPYRQRALELFANGQEGPRDEEGCSDGL
jgi:hypothetical protein